MLVYKRSRAEQSRAGQARPDPNQSYECIYNSRDTVLFKTTSKQAHCVLYFYISSSLSNQQMQVCACDRERKSLLLWLLLVLLLLCSCCCYCPLCTLIESKHGGWFSMRNVTMSMTVTNHMFFFIYIYIYISRTSILWTCYYFL